MALSRTAWIAAGLLARLLMIAVLAMTVQSRFANRVHYDFKAAGYNNDLQSYTYAVVAAAVGMAGSVLQIPVAVYLLYGGKWMTPSSLILDVSMYADIVVTVVLASAVGAGFGATDDVLEYVKHGSRWQEDATQDLAKYYQKGLIAIVFLLIGMVLSVCATVHQYRDILYRRVYTHFHRCFPASPALEASGNGTTAQAVAFEPPVEITLYTFVNGFPQAV